MKQVFVIRHAPKDKAGHLTKEGKELIQKVRHKLKKFDLILSSDMQRARETTFLLTGIMPITDKRASIPNFTREQEEELFEMGKTHPAGIAGVIFDTPLYRDLVAVR